MRQKERYDGITEYFMTTMPEANTELVYNTTFQLLVSVILSAQCTDRRVNMVTPALFQAFPDAKTMASASPEEIYTYIRSISYPNNKASNLSKMARMLCKEFNGEVPSDINALMSLPGVGRKTANVICAVVWQKGVMPVDTHVFRVSSRIGLTRSAKTPRQAELQLEKNFPDSILPLAHHWLILHGRYVCKARKPDCSVCGIREFCAWKDKTGAEEKK